MTDLRRTDRSRMRALNTQLVVDRIRGAEATSQADLIQATKLTTGTIVSIVRDLCRRGLVVRAGQGVSRGGRRPTLLRLNHSAATVLCCQVGSDTATVAVLDLGAEILARRDLTIERERGPEAFMAALVTCLQDLLRTHAPVDSCIAGLGLSLHGAVDAHRGVMLFSEHLGWRDVPFGDQLQQALGVPVFAEGETRTMTLAERRQGAAQGAQDFVLVELDTGIGMVQVLEGKLCRGRHHLAGELGFTVWDTAEPAAGGQRPRVLEDIASLRALCHQAEQVPEVVAAVAGQPPGGTTEAMWLQGLVSASLAGHAAAREILDNATHALGIAIANIVNLLDPELVLLTGRLVYAADGALVDPLCSCIQRHLLDARRAPRIECAVLGTDAALLGAAGLVIDHFLSADNLARGKPTG
ncbi:MAG: ROK family protein [Victivallales bacterium]|nr:ROK family protein [Victivallales bacterium]